MELLILIILYYLSQNPDFERSVKPLLGELKNSEQALKFLEELSQFSKLFSSMQGGSNEDKKAQEPQSQTKKQEPSHTGGTSAQAEKSANSPTAGIADGFIEELLSKYFQSGK
jgi:hypothetical protein